MLKKRSAIDRSGKRVEWRHPGGKLRRLGPTSLTDKELLAIVIGQGIPGKSSEEIAEEILDKHHSLYGLMGVQLKEIMQIKGLKEVKVTQLAAIFEIVRRIIRTLERE